MDLGAVTNYAEKVYNTFDVQGEQSYEMICQLMKECDSFVDKIGATDLIDQKDFTDFLFAFFLPLPAMGPKLNIHHHGVNNEIIDASEQATFVEYSTEPWSKLQQDFEIGKHLKPLLRLEQEILDKDVIIIKAQDQDTAYTALKYTAANIRSSYPDPRLGVQWRDAIEDEDDEDIEDKTKFGFATKMPIVRLGEIRQYYSNFEDVAPNTILGNLQGLSNGKPGIPYYMKNARCPLCVTVDSERSYPDLEDLLQKLGNLKGRSHLILLIAPERNLLNNIFKSLPQNKTNEITAVLEFEYAREALRIESPEIGDGYYEAMLHHYMDELGCRLSPTVNIVELFSAIKKAKKELNATIIEKTVLNAFRRGGKKYILRREDFAFLNITDKVTTQGHGLSAEQELHKQIIGQDGVKKQILDAMACYKINEIRRQAGLPDNGGGHKVFAFIGAPGTAKTTVAQIMGEMMLETDLLPGNRMISLSGAQLKAPYLGQTAHLVKSIFDDHDVIILDEVYALTGDNSDPYAQEALAQLCIELEEHGQEKLICFLGYGGDVSAQDNKMKVFIESNPGLASRINQIITFKSYDPYTEMPNILNGLAINSGFNLSAQSLELAAKFFAFRSKQRDAGNGRECRRLLERASVKQAVRLTKMNNYSMEDLKQITEDDIELAIDEILRANNDLEGRPPVKIGF